MFIGNFERFMQNVSNKAGRSVKCLTLMWAEDEEYGRNGLSCLDNELWKLPQLTHLRFDLRVFTYEDFCAAIGLKILFQRARRWFVEVAKSRGDKFAALELVSADVSILNSKDEEAEVEDDGQSDENGEEEEEGGGGG
ncbi:uncharacterized protein IWZ02DRAFT_430036 [Phyllosticta citriasiana]|uniref:uncharacterized protein n=1 Tax=Phyllosticta citriasiana TaxID=595635 RepID=UPI0030FDA7B8